MKKLMRNAVIVATMGLSFNATASGLSAAENQMLFDSLSVGDQAQVSSLSQAEMAQTQGKFIALLITIASIAAADSAIVQGMMSDYADATKEKDEVSETEQPLSDVYFQPDSSGAIFLNGREIEKRFIENNTVPPHERSACDTFCEQYSGV
jgi:Na+-transporting NADH:ubiquinone oxidoreductase subunit NqrF